MQRNSFRPLCMLLIRQLLPARRDRAAASYPAERKFRPELLSARLYFSAEVSFRFRPSLFQVLAGRNGTTIT